MPKCPKCDAVIERLYVVTVERNLWYYTGKSFIEPECLDSNIEYWKCPRCHKELDIDLDEDAAARFLKGAIDAAPATQ